MIKNIITSILMIVITLILAGLHLTFTAKQGVLQQFSKEEKNAVAAIALYPEKERIAILEAAANSEILVRMQNIQNNTSEKFKSLLDSLPEEDQKKIFNLARYPDVIDKICLKQKNTQELEMLVSEYPKEIQEQAVFANQKYYSLLLQINQLNHETDLTFSAILKNYQPTTQQAYKTLLKLPEVITILNKNMSTTVLLGDLYKKHPNLLKKELDSLNLSVTEQKTKELNEWKQNLEDNPDAMAEYEESSKEFAKEQGVNESDYTNYIPDENKTPIEVRYVYQSYPYWFGWPWWYNYEIWYPYPAWYHCGYYYGASNVIVFVTIPSNYYLNWHFHRPNHFYNYPHFTDHVVNYYYGHRNSQSSISTVVSNWEKEVRPEVPKNFLDNDKNRVVRIKEYGKFKIDYQTTVDKTSGKVPRQMDYLKNNANKYPNIKPVLQERPTSEFQKPVKQRNIPINEYVVPKYEPREKIINNNRSNYQDIDRAEKYHKNNWTQPIPRQTNIKEPTPIQPVPRQTNPKQKLSPRKNN